ncbi:hypothetical protein BH20ACT3_BH20ACT3_05410 [soil metagenome]
MRRSELRDRLDGLRARFHAEPTRPSTSIDEAA